MISDRIKKGIEKSPQRSLLKAVGYSDNQIQKPLIGIVNSFNEIIPGHIHLQNISRAVKDGVLSAGGTPSEFNVIGVCDGIAMGHEGMKYSLSSRVYSKWICPWISSNKNQLGGSPHLV
ncbi:Dihydroxy-acid dehydratase [bioreactor metagenome]|uniref:Dihydroxy-acid dehydratase n=1 Tax=bioreactor metagenome TaxID=1076179 RepID=A0A645DC62_9ZZZZ